MKINYRSEAILYKIIKNQVKRPDLQLIVHPDHQNKTIKPNTYQHSVPSIWQTLENDMLELRNTVSWSCKFLNRSLEFNWHAITSFFGYDHTSPMHIISRGIIIGHETGSLDNERRTNPRNYKEAE